MTIIVIGNGIIRSITVVQVQYNHGEKAILEVKKYHGLFPLLTALSLFVLFILLLISLIVTVRTNNYNKKRLTELRRLFESVGIERIDTNNPILDESDLIVIESWNKSVEEVEVVNQKREKYFSQMIHDLNAPIQILKMNAKMNTLKDDKKYALTIEQQLRELEGRISNFLHIEKISYFEKPEFKPVMMEPYLNQIAERFEVLSVDMTINYMSKNTEYLTDKVMYEKIIQNLIENAIKYGTNKKITINVTENKLQVINDVADDTTIDNIFIEKERKYSQTGNGLGVEIIKTYAKLLKLRIESKTANNKFIVTIENDN